MALLRKAADAGYRIAANFRMDSALDPLRKREDFTKLIEELEILRNRDQGSETPPKGTYWLAVLRMGVLGVPWTSGVTPKPYGP